MFDNLNRKLVPASIVTSALVVAVFATASGQSATGKLPPPFATPSAVNFPTVIGWPQGAMPRAPSGFRVDLFASDLPSARWIYVLPNNDVLVAQANTERFSGVEPAALEALKKAGNMGPSPNRITLLRDGDGDGRFETREVFLSGLNQPFGMLLLRDHFYVANTDSVMRYRYTKDARRITDM